VYGGLCPPYRYNTFSFNFIVYRNREVIFGQPLNFHVTPLNHPSSHKKSPVIFHGRYISIAVIVLILLALFLPRVLLYSEKPEPSDAILVLVGPVMKARLRYARQLQQEKYGNVILIPAYRKIITGSGRTIPFKTGMGHNGHRPALSGTEGRLHFCSYMEDTHRELIIGKRMMLAMGLNSVIIVSSPYHMTRIRFIAHRLFNTHTIRLNFAATPYGPRPSLLWWADRDQRWWVFNEWIKLVWFVIYFPFCNT